MISPRASSLSWLAAIPLLLSVINSAAVPISITNQGFEAPAVDEGIYNQAPTGWLAYNGTALGTDAYAYDPSVVDFLAEAPEGENIVGLYGLNSLGAEKGISQTLSATFNEGATYELSFKVGYTETPTPLYNSVIPGYRVQLLAGNTVIKEDNNSLNLARGVFGSSTITYVYDPILHSGLLGQPLQIRLINKNLTNLRNEVAFDDVQLTALLANPVAEAGGPYYLPNPYVSLSLNASASLPSGTGTISSYEWDLDNDGQFDDATGVNPAAISYSDLQNIYGMVDGSNTVRLRVTDTSAKTATALATVQLVASTKYTGPNGSTDTWNSVSNWDNGVPQGELDVVIQSGKNATPWSDATPNFRGNLTLQNNSALTIGWTTILLGSYNALGTPGFTKIIMNPGSYISTRMGGTPVIPEIQLNGNAAFSLGSSTTPGANAQFNYPITGAYQFQILGNNRGNCIANLNVLNGFSSLLASGNEDGLTIIGNAAGSLGTGNVTIGQRIGNTTNYAILQINAANSMADTATLSMSGTSPTRLTMNANDTIAALIINGVSQAAGTYGSLASSATNKFSWITGTGILTVATPPVNYWDINGTTAGAGGTSPTGTWNTSNTFWNATVAGTGSVAAWTAGRTPIFSAGSDATGAYAVDVVGSQDIGGLIIRSGSLALTGSGPLRLTSNSNITVDAGSSTIATPINESSSRILSKSGAGSLTLSGNLSHTGDTNLSSGNLTLSGNNSGATGATTISSGVLRVDTPLSIPGTGQNVTLSSSATLVFGPSFDSATITAALGRVVSNTAGTIAADNNPSDNFNFSAAGLTNAYFGAISNVNYAGTLTPHGSAYRLCGDTGTLTMTSTNALTGACSLTTRGYVVLAAGNNYSGPTTVPTNGSLSLLGSTGTSGITLNTETTLTVGHNNSLGIGTLTLSGLSTLKAVGTVVTTNDVAANSDFMITGNGDLTLGTTTINANRTITNTSIGNTTFSAITRNGSNNWSLTFNGSGNTTVTSNLTLGTGILTKNDSSTLTLKGVNTYSASIINGGTLLLEGSTAGAVATTINAATLLLGSASNGGLASGNITMNHASAVLQAVSADRAIINNIILGNNGTISGDYSLSVLGSLINSGGNRTLTNNITSGKVLSLEGVTLSNDVTNRTLTITGSGTTVIPGTIASFAGSSGGNLVKSGSGMLILNGSNSYLGTTLVNQGTLLVNGTSGAGAVTINSGATLSGTGTINGTTAIAPNGRLEFNISSSPSEHQKLTFASGCQLNFTGASVLTITGTPPLGIYTLLTAPGGIIGSLPSLNISDDWYAELSLSLDGKDLLLDVQFTGIFPDPPTLTSITDNQSGGPVSSYSAVTYTITFTEDMDSNTVTAADFSNAGTASITVDSIVESTPGVFTIQVTPMTNGTTQTLQLRINQGATLRSASGLNLNTSAATLDDTTLTVNTPTNGVLAVSSGDLITSGNPGGPFSPSSKIYTLKNFGSSSLDWTVQKSESWLNLSSPGGTLAPGASTTVTVSTNAGSLAIGSYFDTIAFTNTSFINAGNTTRSVSLTVNGLPVLVTLGNLNQTYDGAPKAVSVSTNPVKTYSLTYNNSAEVPTAAGNYDIVATVTEAGYTGSATGTLVISKAPQIIDFAALSSVGNDQTSITLTATSSSNLPVSFTSSDSAVATVTGNTVTIVGVGTTTITANQEGDENYDPADPVARSLTVTRTNPLAVPGGPYTVSNTQNLTLDGSGSFASDGATITAYDWDLDDSNDGGGAFTANVTGATPTAITMATLQSTYGMTTGSNPIRLRVTDTAGKISIVSTTVNITTLLKWDANGLTALQTDGNGEWFNPNLWYTGSSNTTWTTAPIKDVTFGSGGGGGAVTLNNATSVGSMSFNSFTGTYNIGTIGQDLTIYGGINKTAASAAVTILSPILLGAAQTWTNNSTTGSLNFNNSTVNNQGYLLTFEGNGNTTFNGAAVLSGAGGLTKNGSGKLTFFVTPTYLGTTTINGGVLHTNNYTTSAFGPGNLTMNGGILEHYWGSTFTRMLGTGPGEVQIIGGASGFSAGGDVTTININNDPGPSLVWGSTYFNPSSLVLGALGSGGSLIFANAIDLNGTTRTVSCASTGSGNGTFSGIISNSSATPAGLIKTGPGRISLNNANTYNGGTTLVQGTLQLGNLNGLGSSIGNLTVNGGLLNLNNIAAVTVGNLTGTAGTIANSGGNGAGTITFTIGAGGGTGGNFQGVLANTTNAGTGVLALTKTGTGSITLSGANTYTGATTINQGKLFINGSTAASNITVANGATLGGNGTLGGNASISPGGKLEFNLSTPAGSHNPLDFASGKGLTFNRASELTINFSGTAAAGTYVLVTGGNNIIGVAPATLNLSSGATATVSVVGNELRLVVTYAGDITPPLLTNIADNQSGDSTILINSLVTYTVSFNEDINASTVSSADFANAGTAAITIGTITETTPGVFTMQVTPTSTGTLQLRVPIGAVIQDIYGNALATTSAINDDWTTTVTDVPYTAWSNAGSFNTDANGDGIPNGLAWLLGAANPNSNATDSLPDASQNSGNLTLSFRTLEQAGRGTALIRVQYSKDLGVTDLWTANNTRDAIVPGSAGTNTVNGITFVTTTVAGGFLDVQATIPASAASPGTKLFSRIRVDP